MSAENGHQGSAPFSTTSRGSLIGKTVSSTKLKERINAYASAIEETAKPVTTSPGPIPARIIDPAPTTSPLVKSPSSKNLEESKRAAEERAEKRKSIRGAGSWIGGRQSQSGDAHAAAPTSPTVVPASKAAPSSQDTEAAARAQQEKEAAAARQAQEQAAARQAQEGANRKAQEEAAARNAQEEAAARKAQEAAARKSQEEAAARKAQQEEAAARKAQEAATRQAQEASARKAQEDAARKAQEEAAARKAQEEAVRKAEEARARAASEAQVKAHQEHAKKAQDEAAKQQALREQEEERARIAESRRLAREAEAQERQRRLDEDRAREEAEKVASVQARSHLKDVEEEERTRRVQEYEQREKAREAKRAELYQKYKQRQAAEAEALVQKEMKAYDLAHAHQHSEEAVQAYAHIKHGGTNGTAADHSAPALVAPKTTTSAPVVRFSLPYGTQFGQLVAVVGGSAELGNWDAAQALKLTWNTGNIWEGDLRLSVAPSKPVEYKFVIVDTEGHAHRWEGGANRLLSTEQITNTAGHPVVVSTVWHD